MRTTISMLMSLLVFACAPEDPEPTSEPLLPRPCGTPKVGRNAGDVLFGAFTYGGIWRGIEPVEKLEAELEYRLDVVHWFMNFSHVWDPSLVETASRDGRLPMISWQPHTPSSASIAAGTMDDYIRSWARGAAKFGKPLYLRLAPEMNGSWVGWNGDPESFRSAWRHIVTLFREEGANNVLFVFSPNITDDPRTDENRMENYYPGEAFVDVLALDGYNWGTHNSSGWRDFETIFDEPMARIAKLGPQAIWLAEIGSAETGGDKAAWVKALFQSTKYPRLGAVIWFDEDKGEGWPIRSSQESLEAFRACLAP